MLLHEFEKLTKVKQEKVKILSVDDLLNKEDRTLLYGFTCDRDTWHVYLKDNEIHTVIYKLNQRIKPIDILMNEDYVPNKRLYPERCDYEFCQLLKQKGISLPFTTWQEDVDFRVYYGQILEEVSR